MPRSLDAIVVGAGHNGLTAALYLARAGLHVRVVETQENVGGMTATLTAPADGFRHNPHANYLFYQEIAPVMRDFPLGDHGLRWVTPDAQQGLPFSDGGLPVVFHRPGLAGRTRRSLARHSPKDAELFAELRRRSDRLTPALADAMFEGGEPGRFVELVRSAFDGLVSGRMLGRGTALGLIEDLFRSERIRTALSAMVSEFGTPIGSAGSDLAFLGSSLWMLGRCALPIGGMSRVTAALLGCARELGVEVLTRARVVALDVRGGTVEGVITSDVAASAPVVLWSASVSNLAGLLQQAGVPWGLLDVASNRPAPTIATAAIALTETPKYSSGGRDGDIDRCFRTLIGIDSVEDVLASERDKALGHLPAPSGSVRVNSLWDASQAPGGRHVAGVDVGFPDPAQIDEATWTQVEEGFATALVERWTDYAPNVAGSVLATAFSRPDDYERKLLVAEGDPHLTPLHGLFLCGAAVHPGGGVHGGPGRGGARSAKDWLQNNFHPVN